MKKTKILQVRFTEKDYAALDKLKEKAGECTKSSTIRSALRLFLLFVDMQKKGWEIQFEKNGKVKTPIIY